MIETDRFIFFWGGPFSQWTPSEFNIGTLTFTCCEQWMMYNKAKMFCDVEAAVRIMLTKDPSQQKAIGREVANFEDDTWMEEAYDIVVQGNRAKFGTIPMFNQILRDTEDKTIVEASPHDRRWGIGMREDAAGIEDPSNWRGQNLLGQAIMQVRDELFG